MLAKFWVLGCMALLLSLAGPLAARPWPHDYHVCITEINYNAQTHALELTFKLFTDDIERSMKALGAGELRLGDPREAPEADARLLAYLQNRFSMQVNGKPTELHWVGKEVELDGLWCYVEILHVSQVNQISITNRILTELFDDQANVVHVTAQGTTQSLFLSKAVLSGQLSF